MTPEISKFDDVIDSRDVIARIEELEGNRKPWGANWNMPGYMPDNEAAFFETWEDARDYLAEQMAEHAEEEATALGEADETADAKPETPPSLEGYADGSAITEYFGKYAWEVFAAETDGLDPEEAEELAALKALVEQASGYAADWEHGETLIRDSYFETYAQELAEDIGAINSEATWPNNCIDWEQAARELRMDYTSVSFDGVDYWIR